MERPKISVVTPSYNQAEFIEETLQSVRDQTYSKVEHIVVDGGSDDGTIEILEEYEDQYDLRWVSEPDRGQSHAVNKGIEMADGEWIGWQNSDDYYSETAFERMYAEICRRPDADVVYGDTYIVDREGVVVNRSYHIQPSTFVQRYANVMAIQGGLFHRRVFDVVGGIDEHYDYVMDTEFFMRLVRSDLTLVHIPEFLGYFRTYDEAKTGGSLPPRHYTEQQMFKEKHGVPLYERLLPTKAVHLLANGVKALYLLREGRFEAFRQDIDDLNLTERKPV